MPFLSIRDDSHPFLVFDPNTVSVPWNRGHMHEIALSSTFMRITARGLHYAAFANHYQWSARESNFHATLCERTPDALCLERANHSSMLYFPTISVDLPDDMYAQFSGPGQTPYVQEMMALNASCTNPTSGRIIRPHDDRYELSLCDLIDNQLDIVFDTHNNRLLWRRDNTSMLLYIFVSILGIYLVSCLAENIRCIMSGDHSSSLKTKHHPVYNVMLLLTLVFLVYDQSTQQTTDYMLFQYERDLHTLLTVFIYVSGAGYAWDNVFHSGKEQEAVKAISMLTGSLILLTARVHYTFDNPYTWILSLIFAVRSAHKFLNRITEPRTVDEMEKSENPQSNISWQFVKGALHLFDAYVLINIITYAIIPGYDLASDAEATVFLVLVIALMAGTLIAVHGAKQLS